jgi:hypothetical protein
MDTITNSVQLGTTESPYTSLGNVGNVSAYYSTMKEGYIPIKWLTYHPAHELVPTFNEPWEIVGLLFVILALICLCMALAYYLRKIQTTPGNPQHVNNMISQLLWIASNLLYITITYTHFGLSQVVLCNFVQSFFRFSRDLATLHNAAQTTRVFLNLAMASFLQKVAVYGILFAVHISLFWAMYLSWVLAHGTQRGCHTRKNSTSR